MAYESPASSPVLDSFRKKSRFVQVSERIKRAERSPRWDVLELTNKLARNYETDSPPVHYSYGLLWAVVVDAARDRTKYGKAAVNGVAGNLTANFSPVCS